MTRYLNLLLLSLMFFACSEEKEILQTETVADYMPLHIGQSITYRLDSTVFERSGTVIETHKYQVRHTVTGETTDNTGNKAYVVQRTINNENATGSWINNGTLIITSYDKQIDVTDNNLRTTVLQGPIKQGFSWNGNSRLPSAPYSSLYDMGAGYDMNKWTFNYQAFDVETIQGTAYNDVWTVVHHQDSLNIPPGNNTSYGFKEVSTEKYAKNIGLVYKDFHLYEFQGPSADNPSAHYTGFGITMWIIGRN